MSRPTDFARGAQLALDAALLKLKQPDLFGEPLGEVFWRGVADEAHAALDEVDALNKARRA